MMIDQLQTLEATATHFDTVALHALRLALPGRVFTPEDAGYDQARAGFSVSDRPAPDVVVTVTSSDDVVTAVNFARTQQLPVSVKATGHNFGFPHRGGLMINTERMQEFSIDPQRRTARVEAGVRWGPVIDAAHAHGLAPLNGSAPHVGVVGYSLFGGFGWLLRKYGAAVDSVVAADIVTADGQIRHVSETSEPALFWALRGASGNFGIVTALEFKLYPVSEMYGGALIFPLERAHEIMTAYSAWVETLPDELTSSIVMLRVPPLPEIPEVLRGKAIVTIRAAYLGTEAEGAKQLAPLRALGGLLADTFRMMPYPEARTINNDPLSSVPARRSMTMLKDLSEATVEALVETNGVGAATAVKVIEIRHLGGAMTRVAPNSNAFSQRFAPFAAHIVDAIGGAERAGLAQRNTAAVFSALQPHSTGGTYPSWLGEGNYGVDRMRAAYSSENYARLVALKTRYDPANMFRLNHNIPPAK